MYVLSIGLNDKVTLKQAIATNNAVEIVKVAAMRHCGGYSLAMQEGGYTMDDGSEVHELSIRLEVFTDDEIRVKALVHLLKAALNQESIAVTRVYDKAMFW